MCLYIPDKALTILSPPFNTPHSRQTTWDPLEVHASKGKTKEAARSVVGRGEGRGRRIRGVQQILGQSPYSVGYWQWVHVTVYLSGLTDARQERIVM